MFENKYTLFFTYEGFDRLCPHTRDFSHELGHII